MAAGLKTICTVQLWAGGIEAVMARAVAGLAGMVESVRAARVDASTARTLPEAGSAT